MGRYFDRLCRIAERENDTVLIQCLKEAKLFVFDGDPAEFIPKAVDFDKAEELINGFFLPFPTIAIEDDKGIVLLQAADDHSRQMKAYDLVVNQEGFAQLTISEVHDFKYSGEPEFPIGIYLYDGAMTVLFDKSERKVRALQTSVSNVPDTEKFKNITAALYEVMILNTPSRFVFEIAPAKGRKNVKKILRSDDRSVFTLLTPGEIKKRYGLDGAQKSGGADAGVGKVPHPRRRHLRTLHSEKFRHKQGQTITIPACWVGPEEKQVGNKIYRVRLDV
ncbi:hypothetical protein [Candidatus Magnetaquicoccus inordinatus]|uniref:hypothetical protein n=1 Tax=Candidatus Magnetaquicoccus inordinatus TaxID=2496818 RepID=UPI00102CE8BB|nr:hypothetical protein [Candidatus Magnetaquicoccus inordinatus]